MRRRGLLAALGTGGVTATAGCGALASEETLTDPTVLEDAPGRRTLVFDAGSEEVGHFGVDGSASGGILALSTELWHRDGTRVESIRLRLWLPDAESAAGTEVALVSPVEGDSSPPPSITLSTPSRGRGTVIEITDLDDLADETISTIELLVSPGSETATTLAVDCQIELASTKTLGTDYTLDGELELSYPALAGGSP